MRQAVATRSIRGLETLDLGHDATANAGEPGSVGGTVVNHSFVSVSLGDVGHAGAGVLRASMPSPGCAALLAAGQASASR
mmetsp:Transcript_13912/g.33619  ORF Transcript_13912/g.33619 Transcript_13912/m.33619 type:complete len:80 (+) Transcript_13912:119-358(+)